MQLQRNLRDLHERGLGLAAISYDPPATLEAFAEQRGITFPLLSDDGSETIKRYDILNAEATGRTAGIPYPGTFVLDAQGVVVSRSFEERYQERATASSLAARTARARQGRPAASVETPHLTMATSASDSDVAPGTRFSLFIDIVPKPKMHVYAPGEKDAIPVTLALALDESFKAHPSEFPKAEKYFFAPLTLTQFVYSKPFRITQDVTLALTPALRERARATGAVLAITGTLRYQACDDKVCYLPKEIPLSWTVAIKPLER